MQRIILGLVLASVVGGLINILRDRRMPARQLDPASNPTVQVLLTSLYPFLYSVAAACAVPLFLSLTKSALLAEAMGDDNGALAVVFGIGVIAAVSSQTFLDSITSRALQQIRDNTEAIVATNEAVLKTQNTVDALDAALDEGAGLESGASLDGGGARTQDDEPSSEVDLAVLSAFTSSGLLRRSVSGVQRAVRQEFRALVPETLQALTARGLLKHHAPTASRRLDRWEITTEGRIAVTDLHPHPG